VTGRTAAPLDLLRQVVSALRSHVVVVKNPDIWASVARSGDWDLVADDIRLAYRTLTAILGEPVRVNNRSYVMNINWDWGHIDLLPDIRWRGIRLLSASAVLEGGVLSADLPVARLAHQAVSACVFSVLAYGHINPRYSEVWDTACREDSAELKAVVDGIFGRHYRVDRMRMGELESAARTLRRAAVLRSLCAHPGRTISRSAVFAIREGAVRCESICSETGPKSRQRMSG
jgi:hypothetical protein